MKTLYEEIREAGIPYSNHESDLYFQATEQSRAILARHELEKGNATTFINQAEPHKGERWYDVPFAYIPFWGRKSQSAKDRADATKADTCKTWMQDLEASRAKVHLLLEALRECITEPGANCLTAGTREALFRRLEAINMIARAAIQKAEGRNE